MKTKFILLTIIMTILLGACANKENSADENAGENLDDSKTDVIENNNAEIKTIDLNFTPVPIIKLTEGLPKEEWTRGQSIDFGNLPNQKEATIHMYIDANANLDLRPGEGTIYGFLEYENKTYELGVISSYGFDDVVIKLEDRNLDGIKDINIFGGMGATYEELKIISYNEANKEWENLLTMGSADILDLDKDGKEELVAGSRGSMPSFVEIYRWNSDHFERVSITDATGNLYAQLDLVNGEWIIVTGEANSEPTLYKYENGKLIEQRH